METAAPQKRIAVIEDLSFVGRCSALIAAPAISAAGAECCFIPTVLLSAHTGFVGAKKLSVADFAVSAAEHYRELGVHFDAIYTGYTGGESELDAVLRAVDILKDENTLIITDPAFADKGKMYGGYGEGYPRLMRKLCERADVILPNVTEAELILARSHKETTELEYALELLDELSAVCGGRAVLSGLRAGNEVATVAKDGKTGESVMHRTARIDAHYFGTGDLFASVFTALFVKNGDFSAALKDAADFTAACVRDTFSRGAHDSRFGVEFEGRLAELKTL